MMDRASAQFDRLYRVKRDSHRSFSAASLGEEMVGFFKQSVQKRQGKLVRIAEAWSLLVPPLLCEHCALEGFLRGTLMVIVDSSSHLYELKQLLQAGIEDQLLLACRSVGLRKITLKPGRWYEGASSQRKPKFR
ncbi:MAG TPA: DciA family protein [Tepidisphaeraceae bacterium]|nr:DciA family protein [Tepidisphaeraceae bacterium]